MNIVRESIRAEIDPQNAPRNFRILVGAFVVSSLVLCAVLTLSLPYASAFTTGLLTIVLAVVLSVALTVLGLKVEAAVHALKDS